MVQMSDLLNYSNIRNLWNRKINLSRVSAIVVKDIYYVSVKAGQQYPCTYIHIHTYTHIRVYTHIFTQYTLKKTHKHKNTHTHIHTENTYINIYTHIHTNAHTHIQINGHTHIHINA